jgi:hypothetical protein
VWKKEREMALPFPSLSLSRSLTFSADGKCAHATLHAALDVVHGERLDDSDRPQKKKEGGGVPDSDRPS